MPSLLDGAGQNMILTQQRNAVRMEPSNHIKETFFFPTRGTAGWHTGPLHTSLAHMVIVEKNGG